MSAVPSDHASRRRSRRARGEPASDRLWARADLGRRLREIRTSRSLSLAEVAQATGISASFLSLVEMGKSDITIGRLIRLVRWYGVSLSRLIDDIRPAPVEVVRADERGSIAFEQEGVSVVMLAPDGGCSMAPAIMTYAPGGAMADPARHAGEEFVHVLEGAIELTIGDLPPIRLDAGDSAYYRADVPHSFRNTGSVPARFLGVTAPPNL